MSIKNNVKHAVYLLHLGELLIVLHVLLMVDQMQLYVVNVRVDII